jgi:hypothetical protein
MAEAMFDDVAALEARENAGEIETSIQGTSVLARSRDDPKVFTRTLKQHQNRAAVSSRE